MPEPFIGEIVAVAFNYKDGFKSGNTWLPCNGQSLEIVKYSPLFSLIGTTYGGDGTKTFKLPNLNGSAADPNPRVGIGQGQGQNLSNRTIGDAVGSMTETLTMNEMPAHNHAMRLGESASGGTASPTSQSAAINPHNNGFVVPPGNTQFAANAIAYTGSGQPHDNNQPSLGLWYCIAVDGDFPTFD